MKSVLETSWVENVVGKQENSGNKHFLLLPQCFQKPMLIYCGAI